MLTILVRQKEKSNQDFQLINRIEFMKMDTGIYHGVAARKSNLTPAHCQARLNFAVANLHRDWSNVIFSDEKTFQTDRHQKMHVYRPRNSRYDQRYIQPNQRSGRLTAGIWGWISSDGPGEMCFINRRLNSHGYIEILNDVLLPTLDISYPDERRTFMQVASDGIIDHK